MAALKVFHSYLINAEFEIVMDHISRTYLKNLHVGPSKLARASMQLSQFKFKVCHLAGKKNSATDAISRTENLPTYTVTAEAEVIYMRNTTYWTSNCSSYCHSAIKQNRQYLCCSCYLPGGRVLQFLCCVGQCACIFWPRRISYAQQSVTPVWLRSPQLRVASGLLSHVPHSRQCFARSATEHCCISQQVEQCCLTIYFLW